MKDNFTHPDMTIDVQAVCKGLANPQQKSLSGFSERLFFFVAHTVQISNFYLSDLKEIADLDL
nr:hypothetical protein [uncultured Mucilaginibacter sp.]